MLNGITDPSQQAYRNFQRHVDRLCLLIVASDCSDREIDIERLHLRVQAAAAAFSTPIGCHTSRASTQCFAATLVSKSFQ